MADAAFKTRENRVRRKLERMGFELVKSRRRDPDARDYGRYMVVDPDDGQVQVGGKPFEFSMTLDEVEAWIKIISTS